MTGHNHHHHVHGRRDAEPLDIQDIKSFLGIDTGGNNARQDRGGNGPTSTLIVYKTMKPTFTGKVAGYSTQGQDAPVPTKSSADAVAHTSAKQATTAPRQKSTAAAAAAQDNLPSSKRPSSIVPSTSVATTLAVAVATQTHQNGTPIQAAVSSTSTSSALTEEGMSGGAKAGLAIGLILGIAAVLGLVFFCFRQRKKAQERERLDDEKNTNEFIGAGAGAGAMASDARSAKTMSTAPRLSLRPVTGFFQGGNQSARASQGAGAALSAAGSPMAQSPSHLTPKSAWERPMTSDSQSRANPFGNHAETVDPVNAAGPAVVQGVTPGGAIVAGAVVGAAAGAVGGAAAVGLARGASKRGPKPIDFTKKGELAPPNVMGPPSPAMTDFSVSSDKSPNPSPTPGSAAIAAMGGPANSAVHRVQLEFNPTMDDELALQAGQLVRLLHEYDDGWALCVRLDRQEQGVCPRTCLSTRPVKPRPGPRPGPGQGQQGMRGPGGPGPQGRPMSPAMNRDGRPASPGPNGPGPQYRPQGPSQGRPQSPGPGFRPQGPPQGRSQSPGPGFRQGPPQGNRGPRTESPGPGMRGPRTQSPGPRPESPAGFRPQQGRPASPGPQYQPQARSMTPTQTERRLTPPSLQAPNPQQSQGPQIQQVQAQQAQVVNQTAQAQQAQQARRNTPPQGGPPLGVPGRKPVPGQAL